MVDFALNPNPEDDTDMVDKRTMELMAEFEEHLQEVGEHDLTMADKREFVFHGWTFQKLAGLQLCIEEIATKFNDHVSSPE